MNTNYSKIALLLALGAVAGEVGAGMNVGACDFSMGGLSDATDSALKIKNAFVKVQAESVLDAGSTRKDFERVSKEMNDGGMLKAVDNRDPQDTTALRAAIAPVIQSDINAKLLLVAIKDFNQNLNSDISKIFVPNLNTGSTTDVVSVSLSSKAEIDKLLAKLSTDIKFSDLFKPNKGIAGNLSQAQLENIKFKTNVTASISNALLDLYAGVNGALSKATTSVKIGTETIDLEPLAEKIKLGVATAIGNITDQVSNLALIGKAEADLIRKKADQIKSVNVIMGQLQFVDGGKATVLGHIKNQGLDAWFNTIADAKNTFVANPNVIAPDASLANKQAAMFTALETIFGNSGATQNNPGNTLNFGGNLAAAGQVTSAKLAAAGFGNVDTIAGNDNNLKLGAASTAGSQAKAEQLFDNAMGVITSRIKKHGRTPIDRDAAYRSIIDTSGTSDVPFLTKYYSNMTAYELMSFLDKNLEFVKKNNGKPNFAAQKEAIKVNLSTAQASLEEFAAGITKQLLNENMTSSEAGIFKDKNKAGIQKVMDNVADKIKNIRKEMGDNAVPTVVAKKAAEAKTFADLEASAEFVGKTLNAANLSALSADLKAFLAAEKEVVKANAMYGKMFASLAADPATKVPAEADVAALKALFAAEVQAALVAPATTQTLEEKAEEAKAKAAKAAEEEKAAKEAAFSVGYLNLTTGTAANAKSKEAIAASKALLEEAKKIVDELTSENEGTAADLIKAKKAAAVEMIDKHVENFELSYVEGDGADDAAAKNKAVAAATKLITAKVNAAFGIANVGKTKKGQKVVKGRNSSGRNSRGRNSRGRNSKADVKEVEKVSRRRGSKSAKKENRRRKKSNAQANLNGQTISND